MVKTPGRSKNRKPTELTADLTTLCHYLRYNSLAPKNTKLIWHSYLDISRILPLTVKQVKGALFEHPDHVILPVIRKKRRPNNEPLTAEEREFLLSPGSLKD